MKMENNQEHKIDKIFRKSFENQSVVPPTDAWMGIQTYTIGQVQPKRIVWVRYASLTLLLLLFLGWGVFYFVDSQDSTSMLLTQKMVSGEIDHGGKISENEGLSVKTQTITGKQTAALENIGRVSNPTSVKTSSQITHKSIKIHEESIKLMQRLSEKKLGDNELPVIAKSGIKSLVIETFEDSSVNNYTEYSETPSYFQDNNIEIIKSKPLVLNDLYKKIKENSVSKINENYFEVKSVKTDSLSYEDEGKKKFSLKHPIINFRLGLYKNSVKMNANQREEIPFANDLINSNNIYAFLPTFDIAWKLNNKSRISLNFKYINYSIGYIQSKSGAAYVDPLSPTNKPSGTFKYNSSRDIYEYLTPFGYLTQPVDPKFSFTPKDFNVNLFGKFSAWQVGTNYEYDFIAFRNKKGGIPAMEIYGLIGLNIQKINKYSYSYYSFKNYDPKDNDINIRYNIPSFTQTELGNGSPIVFGYNIGFGIRFQLSKRFGLNISGDYEDSINSWVNDLPFKTRVSILSVESGFFVNL